MRKPLVAIAVVIMISVNAYGYDDIKYDAVNKQLQIYDFIIPLLEDWENIIDKFPIRVLIIFREFR